MISFHNDRIDGTRSAGMAGALSTAVVRAVAEVAGVDATELPPLYTAIEPDALDAIFMPTPEGDPRQGTVIFRYADHRVEVTAEGDIAVEPLAEPD